jgi:hypothetical protein
MTNTAQGKVAGRWTQYDSKRSTHLKRCRLCAKLTIPSLLPEPHTDDNTSLPIPYQGLGARAVNNLAAKLLLTLFPPNTSFYRLDVDPMLLEELKENDKEAKQKIEKQLRKYEQISIQDFEAQAMRTRLFHTLRLLVATGNALLELKDEGTLKVYRLDKYVVRRSPSGALKEIIIEEYIHPDDVPADVRHNENAKLPSDPEAVDIPLYTHIVLKDGQWQVTQEVCGVQTGETYKYPKDKLPYLPLTWVRGDGENYGRGHVEEHLGDLNAYDGLSQSLLEGASAAAFLLLLLKPNATTDINEIKQARNGMIIEGNVDDIGVLRVEKANDFKVAYQQAQELAQSLSRSFLLTESIQRQAERVTAEEIRYMAQELESALGGIYSVLSVELQRPFSELLMANQTKRSKLPKLPKEVSTTIVTGFDALGRGHDLQKLREFRDEVVAMAQAVGKPDILEVYIGLSNFFQRVATAIGLDTDGLVPEPEEIEQLQQQKQMFEQLMQVLQSGPASEITKGMVQQNMQGEQASG